MFHTDLRIWHGSLAELLRHRRARRAAGRVYTYRCAGDSALVVWAKSPLTARVVNAFQLTPSGTYRTVDTL